ncbi:putative amidoligase enzyme-domain-containing protein [Cercophora scortea]|uniref:Amidoligase enzyme-domain-containing protein n=1 Tax=Cercophora scortea TaxID=314031 RepID=A0AAE0IZK7_9PEZI|nr:putative amidoligase enzyme-domain-containing protein [Cercophora scortea]
MTDQNSFQFGVEIELLMGSRKKAHSNWKSLAKDLSKRLLKAGISNHINESNDKSQDNYREWSITQEITIPSQPAKSLFGLELVSPIYSIYASWATDLETIFSVLHGKFTLHPSPHCSTHVHISGTPHPLSPSELAALAKSALYYEPALDALVPPARRGSAYWCQSNRSNPSLTGLDLATCLDALGHAGSSVRHVVEAMNLFPANSPYGRAHGRQKDFVRGKVYKWDFTGMMSGGRGTVEFRQAPGSVAAADATGWVTLAVAFVVGAMAVGPQLGGVGVGEGASAEELWALLAGGAEVLGWESLGAAEGLFGQAG